MSFDDIIMHVQSRPELWLTTHPSYKNRAIHQKIWRHMAKELNIDENILKKRWKHLKDQYRKEVKKARALNNGEISDNYVTTWQWFSSLGFLRGEILAKNQNRVKCDASESESQSEDGDEASSAKKMKKNPGESPNESLEAKKLSLILKKMKNMNDLVENKMKAIEETPKNDPDYMFLMSLLPSMKQLTEIQKLHFRGKINDWLLEAVTQNEYSSSCENKFFFQAQVGDIQNIQKED